MKVRLLHIWEYLRTSFWLIPALMTVCAVGLAFLTVFIDRKIDSGGNGVLGFLYSGGPEGARMVLSTIAGSMITVAGVTFSITIVALQLASSQFGPRLLRNFMHDTGNQFVLGTFIAAFAYCLLVLRTVHTVEGEAGRRIAEDSRDLSADIPAAHSGYLQAFDHHGLRELATENDLLVLLPCRPGDFVAEGTPLISVKSKEELDGRLTENLLDTVIVGAHQTPEQDAEFAVHQLVEVAIRALSPGINDPYTAVSCVDRLGSALCFLCGREFPSPYLYDREGNLRIVFKPETFTGILNAAFDQIRQYGRQSVAVTIRLLETLQMVALHARTREQREAILRQAEMIDRSSREGLHEKNDVEDAQRRYRALLGLLGEEVPDR